MKAAIYIRVSTDKQAEQWSLPAQLRELKAYCERSNLEIYEIYTDDGFSAKYDDEKKRPAFMKMLADAEKHYFQIILVHKYDRFARKAELSQKIKNRLKKTGINLISITEPVEDSPMGFLVSGMHDLMAEYYIRNLAQESKKGHVERAKQGLHNGSVPFGYKTNSSGLMVINEDQAKIVRWIFSMYNNEGYGTSKIACILNEHGIKSAVNGQWAHYTVGRVLKNVKYIGKIYYDGEIYPGRHEPIIGEKEFYKVDVNMKDRTWQGSYRGANHNKFLFLGILRCGVCKKVFRVQANTKSATKKRTNSMYYYICNNASHADSKNRCTHKKYYSIKLLEDYLLEKIKNITLKTLITSNIKESNSIDNILDNQKTKLQQEIDRAKQAFIAGVFSLEEFTEIKNKNESEIENIKKSITQQNDTEKAKKMKIKIENLMDKFKIAESIPEKKSILKEFIEVIYIGPDLISIDFVL